MADPAKRLQQAMEARNFQTGTVITKTGGVSSANVQRSLGNVNLKSNPTLRTLQSNAPQLSSTELNKFRNLGKTTTGALETSIGLQKANKSIGLGRAQVTARTGKRLRTFVLRDKNNIPLLLNSFPAIMADKAEEAADKMEGAAKLVWRTRGNPAQGISGVFEGLGRIRPWQISDSTRRLRANVPPGIAGSDSFQPGNPNARPLKSTGTLVEAMSSTTVPTGRGDVTAVFGFENAIHPNTKGREGRKSPLTVGEIVAILEDGWTQSPGAMVPGPFQVPGFKWLATTADIIKEDIMEEVGTDLLTDILSFATIKG